MGPWALQIFYSFSAWIIFRRQNQTSKVSTRIERDNIGSPSATLAPLLINPYSAGIDFSRQNITSVDARL